MEKLEQVLKLMLFREEGEELRLRFKQQSVWVFLTSTETA